MIFEGESVNADLKGNANYVAPEEHYSVLNEDNKSVSLLINQEIGRLEQSCLKELRDNDRKIISFLQQESGGYRYTFNGLARQLKMHQQSLARSLHRLVKLGIIQKSNDGYGLTASSLIQRTIEDLNHDKFAVTGNSGRNFFQLVQAYLPFSPTNKTIIHSLIGRRFGTLRWLGIIDGKNECCLRWVSDESPLLVVVRIISCYMIIETNAMTDTDKVEALVGSSRIYGKVISMVHNECSKVDFDARKNARRFLGC